MVLGDLSERESNELDEVLWGEEVHLLLIFLMDVQIFAMIVHLIFSRKVLIIGEEEEVMFVLKCSSDYLKISERISCLNLRLLIFETRALPLDRQNDE